MGTAEEGREQSEEGKRMRMRRKKRGMGTAGEGREQTGEGKRVLMGKRKEGWEAGGVWWRERGGRVDKMRDRWMRKGGNG